MNQTTEIKTTTPKPLEQASSCAQPIHAEQYLPQASSDSARRLCTDKITPQTVDADASKTPSNCICPEELEQNEALEFIETFKKKLSQSGTIETWYANFYNALDTKYQKHFPKNLSNTFEDFYFLADLYEWLSAIRHTTRKLTDAPKIEQLQQRLAIFHALQQPYFLENEEYKIVKKWPEKGSKLETHTNLRKFLSKKARQHRATFNSYELPIYSILQHLGKPFKSLQLEQWHSALIELNRQSIPAQLVADLPDPMLAKGYERLARNNHSHTDSILTNRFVELFLFANPNFEHKGGADIVDYDALARTIGTMLYKHKDSIPRSQDLPSDTGKKMQRLEQCINRAFPPLVLYEAFVPLLADIESNTIVLSGPLQRLCEQVQTDAYTEQRRSFLEKFTEKVESIDASSVVLAGVLQEINKMLGNGPTEDLDACLAYIQQVHENADAINALEEADHCKSLYAFLYTIKNDIDYLVEEKNRRLATQVGRPQDPRTL